MTNANKFKEVFGFLPDTSQCPAPQMVCKEQGKKYPNSIEEMCGNCPFHHWWSKEYMPCFKLKDSLERCEWNCDCSYGRKKES